MRRISLLFAAVLAAAFTAASAQAAAPSWGGVVVAKDASRKAVIVALPGGAVRTVRSTMPLTRFAVGARVSTRGARLADGTFKAAAMKITGKASRGVVRGVIVRVDRANARFLLSAGGSVFAVGRDALRTSRLTRTTQSSGTPDVGDRVEMELTIADGALKAAAVQTVGQATTLELEGIVTGNVPGRLTLAVAHRGLVDVVVPAGTPALTFAAGDQVELLVTVDGNGVFTLVSGSTDDESGEVGDDDDEDGDDDDEGDDDDDDDEDEDDGDEHDSEDDD
jgi:hypothetical protein